MNLSGESVGGIVNYYKIDPESDLLVIYDDISLDVGQLRIRKKEVRAVTTESRVLSPILAQRYFRELK